MLTGGTGASASAACCVTFDATAAVAEEGPSESESTSSSGADDAAELMVEEQRRLSHDDMAMAARLRRLARDLDHVKRASDAAALYGSRARAMWSSAAVELLWAALPLVYGFRAPRAFFFIYTFAKDGAGPVAEGFRGIYESFENALAEIDSEVSLCDELQHHLSSRDRCKSVAVMADAVPKCSPKERANLWKTAALKTVGRGRGTSSDQIIGGLNKHETRLQLERLFARTTRFSLLQRFLDPEELTAVAKGLHKGVLGSLYRSLSWGASLVFGDSSMAAVIDAFSVGHFLRGLLLRELRRVVAHLHGAATWSTWQEKWADFWISAATTVFSAIAAYRLFPYEHIIGTALLGATALTSVLRRCAGPGSQRCSGGAATGGSSTAADSDAERLTTFYWQLAIAALGAAVQMRLQRARRAARQMPQEGPLIDGSALGSRRSPLALGLAAADRALAPLLCLEHFMKRNTGLIFSLNFNM